MPKDECIYQQKKYTDEYRSVYLNKLRFESYTHSVNSEAVLSQNN